MTPQNIKSLIAVTTSITLLSKSTNSSITGNIISLLPKGLILKIGSNSTTEISFSEISEIQEGSNE